MRDIKPIVRARRDRRLQRQRKSSGRTNAMLLSAGTIVSLLAAGLVVGLALMFAGLTRDLPSIDVLPELLNPPNGLLLQPTRLFDRSGEHVLVTFESSPSPRRYVPLSEANPQHLPRALADAVIASADAEFWTHAGYELGSAADADRHATLAQRLAYELLLYDESPSPRRAVRERLLAAQITHRYGRTQVLEWYLNHAHFGRHAYGAEAAAQLYFGKSAESLTLAESALLAAVSEAPALNPMDASQAALQRGRETLRLVAELGLVRREEADKALAESVTIMPRHADEPRVGAAFVNLVLAQLDTQLPRERLERGGLKVITTLDYDLQVQAACLTEVYARRLAGLPEPEVECEAGRTLAALPPGLTLPDSSVSTLVLDPQAGQVLALVGETLHGNETPLFSAHDPGSLADAFVYLTGFTTGLGPGTLVWDVPAEGEEDLPPAEGEYRGPLRLRTAMANDLGAAAERLLLQMGAENVARVMDSFGLAREAPATPVQLAGAFGAIATQGVYFGQRAGEAFTPVSVLRVEAVDGSVMLDWSIAEATAVLPPAMAYLMTDVLRDQSARALTLGSPNVLELGFPAAVKVGRSENGRDAWTIGYTPRRVVGAWTGTREEGVLLRPRVTAVLFAALMELASRTLPVDGWIVPQGISEVTVCEPSGMLPTRDCPALVSELFLEGSEPQQPDNLFRKLQINRETGYLATVFTPPQMVEERLYLMVPPEARGWAALEGLPIPPDSYDAIQAPRVNADVNITTPVLFENVRGRVRILGSAAGEDFASYRVLVGSGLNPQEWIEVRQSETPVVRGLLAEWDTSDLTGLYAVQLAVRRSDDRLDTALTQVTVGE